jgi:hypothetical protein
MRERPRGAILRFYIKPQRRRYQVCCLFLASPEKSGCWLVAENGESRAVEKAVYVHNE